MSKANQTVGKTEDKRIVKVSCLWVLWVFPLSVLLFHDLRRVITVCRFIATTLQVWMHRDVSPCQNKFVHTDDQIWDTDNPSAHSARMTYGLLFVYKQAVQIYTWFFFSTIICFVPLCSGEYYLKSSQFETYHVTGDLHLTCRMLQVFSRISKSLSAALRALHPRKEDASICML